MGYWAINLTRNIYHHLLRTEILYRQVRGMQAKRTDAGSAMASTAPPGARVAK